MNKTICVKGNKVKATPPLGPFLTSLGLNSSKVVKEINEVTKTFEGLRVYVNLNINLFTKEVQVSFIRPSLSCLIFKRVTKRKKKLILTNNALEEIIEEHSKNLDMLKETLRTQVLGTIRGMGNVVIE